MDFIDADLLSTTNESVITEEKPAEMPKKQKKKRHAITFGDEVNGGAIKEVHQIESYKYDTTAYYNHAEFPKEDPVVTEDYIRELEQEQKNLFTAEERSENMEISKKIEIQDFQE